MSTENEFSSHAENAGAPQPSASAEAQRYHSFSQAIDTARRDAQSRAREAAPKLKEALADAAHDFTYGAAFGACFAAAFVKELAPSGLREAFRRGARDGREAAAKTVEAVSSGPAAEVPA